MVDIRVPRDGLVVAALLALAAGCSATDAASGPASRTGGTSSSGGSSGTGSSSGASGGSADDGGTTSTNDGGGSSSGGSGQGSGGSGGLIGASVTLAGCAECRVHVPPGYAPGKPAPLLVALHGDEGPASGVPSVIQLWTSAADKHGYLVLAVACSSELGCANGNWSGWLANQSYQITPQRMAQLDGWADAMEKLYDIDEKREYLGGYSGGAYVLGYFAQARADRYGGAAFVAGGMPAWTGTGNACPTKKIPGYFLGGDKDPRTGGQMSDTASSFNACGQEIELDIVTNADHGQTIAALGTGRADAILTWFDSRPLK